MSVKNYENGKEKEGEEIKRAGGSDGLRRGEENAKFLVDNRKKKV